MNTITINTKPSRATFRIGDIVLINHTPYIIHFCSSSVDGPRVDLCNISTGRRWDDSVLVKDYENITMEEMKKMLNNSRHDPTKLKVLRNASIQITENPEA